MPLIIFTSGLGRSCCEGLITSCPHQPVGVDCTSWEKKNSQLLGKDRNGNTRQWTIRCQKSFLVQTPGTGRSLTAKRNSCEGSITHNKYLLRLILYRISAFFWGTDLVPRVPGGKTGVYHPLYTHSKVRQSVTERNPNSGPEFKFEFSLLFVALGKLFNLCNMEVF